MHTGESILLDIPDELLVEIGKRVFPEDLGVLRSCSHACGSKIQNLQDLWLEAKTPGETDALLNGACNSNKSDLVAKILSSALRLKICEGKLATILLGSLRSRMFVDPGLITPTSHEITSTLISFCRCSISPALRTKLLKHLVHPRSDQPTPSPSPSPSPTPTTAVRRDRDLAIKVFGVSDSSTSIEVRIVPDDVTSSVDCVQDSAIFWDRPSQGRPAKGRVWLGVPPEGSEHNWVPAQIILFGDKVIIRVR